MKLIFKFSGVIAWQWTNSGFFAVFWDNSKELLPSLEMVTWKSSSDSERPLRVISGFSISDFNLGCGLFIV